MPTHRRPAVATVLVLLTSVLLAGCVSRTSGPADTAVPETLATGDLAGLTLQVGDQKGGTEALLNAAGQLEDLPYQVQFSTFTSGPPQIEAASAGKIDFAITGNTPPVFGAAAGAKVKVVSAYDGGGVGDQILVHDDSALTGIADLKGKSVAVTKGSSAHGHLLGQLDSAGLTPADVTLVFLQPADALSAFTFRQTDAWAIWDPYTAQAEQDLDVRSIGQAKEVTNGYWFGVASEQALADPKRNTALADLLVRFEKAARWAKDNPQQWARSYGDAVGLDPVVAEVSQGRSLRQPTELDDEVVASEQKIADLFAQAGQIQDAPNIGDWVDRRYNETLRPLLADAN